MSANRDDRVRSGRGRAGAICACLLVAACAGRGTAADNAAGTATVPTTGSKGGVPTEPAPAPAALDCLLPTNCVSSRGALALPPLTYSGSAEQGLAALLATIAAFPEAKVVRSGPTYVDTVFTTPAGFTDQVEFVIDPAAQRIDFRSRSQFGLYDLNKNRSRMQAFSARFAQQVGR